MRPQLLYAAMGLVICGWQPRVDFTTSITSWRGRCSALSLVLLTAVLFHAGYNGCKRWLVLPGLEARTAY